MNNFDEIINKPAFAGLTGEQKDFYKQLMERLQGKSGMEAVMTIMEFGRKAPKGAAIGKNEQDRMIEAIMESLPQKDKDNFSQIIKVMRSPMEAAEK